MTLRSLLLAGAGALALSAASARAATIDTLTGWQADPAGAAKGEFGTGARTATYGQVFAAPANRLDGFAFALNTYASDLSFRAQVFRWDGSQATGAALFTSAPLALNSFAFAEVAVATPGLALTSGGDYVALLTVSFAADYVASDDAMAWAEFAWLPGGSGFVFLNNTNMAEQIAGPGWQAAGGLAWRAEFSNAAAVPGPAALGLFGLALAGLALARRR
jgi:hypothetical protein